MITKPIKTILLVLVTVICLAGCGNNVKIETEPTTDITVVSTPETNKSSLCIELGGIESIDIRIFFMPDESSGAYRATVKITDSSDIEDSIRSINDIKVKRMNKSYEYFGGDSPLAWIILCGKSGKEINRITFHEGRSIFYNGRYYKIGKSEYCKVRDLYKKYKK